MIPRETLKKIRRIEIRTRRSVNDVFAGRYHSVFKGQGMEFQEVREYVPGDDTRRLDWRTWGRSDRFYIKEFEADTNLRLCLIVDASGSMDYPDPAPGKRTRMDLARQLGASLAYLAAHQGDAVGLWGVGADHRQKIPSKRGATHLNLVIDQLTSLQPKGETTLIESLHTAAEEIRQRALVIVISDFFVEPAELKSAIQHLRFRRHDVALFHLLAPEEIDFNFDRPARFLDLEGAEPMLIDPSLVATRYREVVRAYLTAIDTLVRDTAIDYHRILLQENPEEILARFLLSRLQKKSR